MMDCYTHLDMRIPDPVADLRLRMSSANTDRALIVETWGKDNYACLDRLIASPSPQFRIALCFRPEEGGLDTDVLQHEVVVALRVKTEDIRHLGSIVDSLESSGKWLLTHAESGIKALKEELVPLLALHPALRVYLPHLGWPRRDKSDDTDWPECVNELSRFPTMMVGISAIGHFSREAYPHHDMEPFAAKLRDAFGADSLVPGSDYPLLEASNYAEAMSLAQRLIQLGSTRSTCRFESSIFQKHDTIKE
ncbi:MAG: amidohydrolase family protein [Acidobacteriaceae bacterium]